MCTVRCATGTDGPLPCPMVAMALVAPGTLAMAPAMLSEGSAPGADPEWGCELDGVPHLVAWFARNAPKVLGNVAGKHCKIIHLVCDGR